MASLINRLRLKNRSPFRHRWTWAPSLRRTEAARAIVSDPRILFLGEATVVIVQDALDEAFIR